ncbi:class I SAM-dependent methyltransferase [Paenibacillus tarimensis]|uniref:class I SAM-dependent methyltransferase n=1 Tax=Paenibacillus tarimensis TaxID=416012 RepID=UPI001F39F933|nr:class I SAM-dependent methyltransferase [Paenibacillus tarimensis]MCF2945223.1 class I SAM-dependent methyltransferase [Paenibacillus tarimensis]
MSMLNRLIEQAKNPKGFIGSLMLSIMNAAHSGMNNWALEKLDIGGHSNILDIGCGGGKAIRTLSALSSHGKIYGIDYSGQAVKESIQANRKDVESGKVKILQASVTDTPFADNYFDVITAFQTHYFWDDLEGGVKEAYRILKKSGCFIITAEVYKINYHMHSHKTKEEMEQLFSSTGFAAVQFYENTSKGWLCIKGVK